MAQHLFGIHDPDPAWMARVRQADKTAWCVISEGIGDDPHDRAGSDYRSLAAYGVTPIVRLNYSHHGQGTIPLPDRYDAFAQRCANFVAASEGCCLWVVGNEPNHEVERVNGIPIPPTAYAACFAKVRQAIKTVNSAHQCIVAAVAPWNVQTGLWLDYWRTMLDEIVRLGGADGLALHTYSRGASPSSVTSNAKMAAPYDQHYNGFRAYRDLLAAVPQSFRHLPVYGTETNQGEAAWLDANTGWVQAAYAEIDAWNQRPSTQKIQCLCLYRWHTYDKWGIADKPGVIADLEAAMQHDYVSPTAAVAPGQAGSSGQHTSYIPIVTGGGSQPPVIAPPRQWDERLTQRGVKIEPAQAAPGQTYWRVVRGQWLDEQESGGRHHIYVDALDEQGQRVVDVRFLVTWPTGRHVIVTEAKPGEPYAANYPMSKSLNEFSVVAVDGRPSERVTGIGMGANGNPAIHTSTVLVFQRTRAADGPQTGMTTPTAESVQEQSMTDIIDPLVGQTIVQVESGGQPFGPDGRLLIRFENHIFKGKLNNDALYARHFQHGSPVWTGHKWRRSEGEPWQEVHTGSQASEYAAFEFAASLNRWAAFESVSMGLGQIMGFNARRVGYASAEAMYRSFSQSSAAQVMAFINFFLSDPQLVQAMRVRDWRTIARLYNGPGNVDNVAPLLEATYRKLAAAA